jgi:hypothetical protein
MRNERSRLIDLPKDLPLPFHSFLLLLSLFIFILYIIFNYTVNNFDIGIDAIFSWERLDEFIETPSAIWNFVSGLSEFPELIADISISILIPYQLLTIESINEKVKLSFKQILFQEDNNEMAERDLYFVFKDVFIQSNKYYISLILIILPFLLIYLNIYKFYSIEDYTIAAGLLDIYNLILYFLVVFLFSIIIWINFAISKSLKILTNKPYKDLMVFGIFNYDRMGGLSHLKDLVFSVILRYSSCISIAVFWYYRPFLKFPIKHIDFMFSYEVFILIILFIIGMIWLLGGLGKIKYLINYRKYLAYHNIERMHQIQFNILEKSLSENDKNLSDELRSFNAISILNYQGNIISTINSTMYDPSKIVSLISSLILPIISKLVQDILLNSK